MVHFIFDGPSNAETTITLAHGAGSPMDSTFMQFFAERLGESGYRIARFEFPYMAERRITGKTLPPDRMEKLLDAYISAIEQLKTDKLIIGGKSMGGRAASLIADTVGVRGLICLGYPFHAPSKNPGPNRLEHLSGLRTKTLICQVTRDTLGSKDEVAKYRLSNSIRFQWLRDGDHGFKPRKASGLTEIQNWQQAVSAIRTFTNTL